MTAPSAKPKSERPSQKVRAIVADFVEEKLKERAPRKERFSKRTIRGVSLALLLVGSSVVWFVPLTHGQKGPLQSPQRSEAGLRVETSLAASRIRAYKSKHGRLPATLADAGVYGDDLRYARDSVDAFTLTGAAGTIHVIYRSTMPDSVFIGNAFNVLETTS